MSSAISAATTTAPIRGRRRTSKRPSGSRPYGTWPAGETKQDLIKRMSARLDELPGFEIAFSQPIIDSVLDNVFDPHSALAVKVFGDDFNELRRIGNDIVARSEHHSRRHRGGDRSIYAAAADRDQGRPRGDGALRHQCRRRRRSDQHRHRRRRRQPGVHRRPPLRRHGALPGGRPQQSRGDRESRAHVERRRAHSAVASRATSSCRRARA